MSSIKTWRDRIDIDAYRLADTPSKAVMRIDAQNAEVNELRDSLQRMSEALQFYADQQHFVLHQDVFDTISGEPQNWQEDESNTIMFEDGTVAKNALA